MADFDRVISRTDTRCVKWDGRESAFGDKDVLPMWVADMDFLSPSPVVEALVRRAQHGVFGYTIAPPSYYHAITDWLHRRHHWTVDPAWILFSPGVVTALSLAVQAFTEPGDKVLLQAPVYHPFYDVIKRHNRVIVNNPLKMENGRYTMDFDDLERCADEGIKMMLLCSPHNPVGRVWSQSELMRLGEFCRERGILVISDEIHSDLVYRPHVHTPFASISEAFADFTVTCIAPSKTFNVAGLKTSSVIISNPALREAYQTTLNRNFLDHQNAFGVVALEAAYNHGEPWLEELLVYLQGNLDYLNHFVGQEMNRVRVIQPEGTYLVWLDFRSLGLDSKQLKHLLLREAKVALDQGYIFGQEGTGFVRMNIACPRRILEEGLSRVAHAVQAVQAE